MCCLMDACSHCPGKLSPWIQPEDGAPPDSFLKPALGSETARSALIAMNSPQAVVAVLPARHTSGCLLDCQLLALLLYYITGTRK